MSINNLISYEILGVKEEFAGWVSNISPYDTPFVSMTGKFPIHNKVFEWQTDRLDNVWANNAWDSDTLPEPSGITTEVHQNYTQILRKVIQVSDTAEALSTYGRPSETEYQIGKASKEIKRDLETILLSTQKKVEGDSTTPRMTSGFYDLTAGIGEAEPESGAITHKKLPGHAFTEEDIFDITWNLNMVGARANTIMFHPIHAKFFANMFESHGETRIKMYDNDTKEFSHYVNQIRDPLGQVFNLLPNDNMDEDMVYFFHPHDWFQRVLRNPTLHQLGKFGSFNKYMLEMEVGLQHRHRWASGILELTYTAPNYTFTLDPIQDLWTGQGSYIPTYKSTNGYPDSVQLTSSNPSVAEAVGDTLVLKGSGTFTLNATATYYKGVQIQASPITVNVTGTNIVSPNKTSLQISISEEQDLAGYLRVSPTIADSMGYTYTTNGSSTISLTGTILKGLSEGSDAEVTIASKADPSLSMTLKITVQAVAHNIKITPDISIDPGLYVSDKLTVTFDLTDPLSDINDFEAIPLDPTGLTLTKTKVNNNKYTLDIVPNEEGIESLFIRFNYPNGVWNQWFVFDIKKYTVTIDPLPSPLVVTASVTPTFKEANGKTADSVQWAITPSTAAAMPDKTTGKMLIKEKGDFELSVNPVFNGHGTSDKKVFTVVEPDLLWDTIPTNGLLGEEKSISVKSIYGDLSIGLVNITSSDDNIVESINNGDSLKYKSEGEVDITASWDYGDGTVTLAPIHIRSQKIKINKSVSSINISVGETMDLNTVFSTDPSGYPITYSVVSSNGDITISGSVLRGLSVSTTPAVIKAEINVSGSITSETIDVSVNMLFNTRGTSSSNPISNGRYQVTQGDIWTIAIESDVTVPWRVTGYTWQRTSGAGRAVNRIGQYTANPGTNSKQVSIDTSHTRTLDSKLKPLTISDYPFDTIPNEQYCVVSFINDSTSETRSVTVDFPAHFKWSDFSR